MNIIALGGLMWFVFLMFAVKNPIKNITKNKRWNIGGCSTTKGKASEPPKSPTAESAIASSALLQELEKMYRSYIGQSISTPAEWGQQGDVYTQLLNYTPEQFAYPMDDIQKALASQQALQLEDYQKQLRPMLAAQGQLDSTYYANLLGDYLQGQQSQSLSNTANLLTNQATQNYNLAQWLPQFKQSVAGSLGNLGQNRLSLEEQNLMLPMNTYIPGLANLYGMGQQTAAQQYQDALAQWQFEEQQKAQPATWTKVAAMFDPGGSLMGNYGTKATQGTQNVIGAGTSIMGAIGSIMGAKKGGGGGGGGVQQQPQQSYTPNYNLEMQYYTPQTQNYGLNTNQNYGFNYNNDSSGGSSYGYNNPYSSWYNPNWR